MHATGHTSGFDDPAAVLDALARWDELEPETLDRLAADPVQGPRLETLRRAEGWLREQASSGRGTTATACPPPEELYDYGRGPGYAPLPEARRAELDAHVRHCLECDLLVESLAQRPPLPLEIEPLEPVAAAPSTSTVAPPPAYPDGATDAGRPAPRSGRLLRWRRLVPALAAASLIALLALWAGRGASIEAGATGLPDAPLLRGELRDALAFPRGRLLAAPRTVELPEWLALASLRRFELAPDAVGIDQADTYRIELLAHFGGAFEEGRRLSHTAVEEPVVEAATVLHSPLPVGHYTWEAWAVVHGLDRRLGARDFEVVEDEELWRSVVDLLGDADPTAEAQPDEARLTAAVRLLHEAGFLTDARALARALPASPERDAYLDRRPGR